LIGADTFLNPLIKVVTTVAVLAAAYFFIVKPILDTTEEIGGKALEQTGRALDQSEKLTRQAEKQAQQQGLESFEVRTDSTKQARRILRCVERAGGDTNELAACGELPAASP
jgi:hypothetical protein